MAHRMRQSLWLLVLVACAGASPETQARPADPPARAGWLRAESAHVIVHGNHEEAALRAFTRRLERFHSLLESLVPRPQEAGRPKLNVYLLQGRGDLERAMFGVERDVAGLYRATPNGTLVIAIARRPHDREGDDVLFHEYTHHFMGQRLRNGDPVWLREGVAEYYSTADVEGARLEIGKPNSVHAQVLLNRPWISFDEVLTGVPWQMSIDVRTAFYAQSWLLTHYLLRNPARWAATQRFLQRAAEGAPIVQAFERELGMTLVQLQLQLEFYLRLQLRHTELAHNLPEPPVVVQQMPESANRLMLPALSLLVGATDSPSLALLRDGPSIFPGDAFALEAAARGALVTSEPQRALALLEPLLSDAATPEQLYLAGTARMALAQSLRAARREGAQAGDAEEEAYTAAGNLFARALRGDPDDYRSLYRYWQVRARSGESPDANLQEVLLRAHELAPQVQEIALAAARMLLRANRVAEAREVLSGFASHPHGTETSSVARQLISFIDGARAGPDVRVDSPADLQPPAPSASDGSAVNGDASPTDGRATRGACASRSAAEAVCN